MGPEIVYVSGRKRASSEMNGKSANLNNCLSYIYPAGTTIPANELVCIFDADQVCLLVLNALCTCWQARRGQQAGVTAGLVMRESVSQECASCISAW